MTGIAPSLPVDDLPLEAHRLLCALGDRLGMTLVTTRDYASRYRAFYGHVSATNPLRPPDTLVRHVTAETLRSYADDLARRLGPRQARLDLVKLAVALRAILPGTVLPDFRIEYARLRQMPEPERPRFRYALAIGDVPAVLLDLVADIDTAERVVDTGKIVDPPEGLEASGETQKVMRPMQSRPALRRILLRFLGALAEAGVDVAALNRDTLVTTQHLDIYIARATDLGSPDLVANCLYSLRSSLRTIDTSKPIAEILARYGIAAAKLNTDYERFVPDEDQILLERALSRPANEREDGEPRALVTAVADKLRRALGAFHRAASDDPALTGVPAHRLDVAAALHRYETRMAGQQTPTLIVRLIEIKAALDRILFERRQARVSGLLGRRIRELKTHVERQPVELPEGVGPRDIERLGRKLIWQARRRLRDLVDASHPYRSPLRLAEQYRDGLIFVMFSMIVLRVGNMAALLFDETIVEEDDTWSIDIPAERSKNGEAIFQTLSPWIGVLVRDYKAWIRPLIAGVEIGVNDHVFWMARHGGPLRAGSFQEIVPRRSLREFEVSVYCHLLRAIEASDAMESMDADIGYGAISLRHKSSSVTRASYQTEKALQRAPAKLPGVKTLDAALPVIDPAAVILGSAVREPKPRGTARG